MPRILRLQHVAVTVPAARLEEARAFYSGVLGLTETPRPPEAAHRPGIWYTFGSTELHIQARDHVPPEPGERHPALVVDNIAAWRQRLLDHGIDFKDQPAFFRRQRFFVWDPFGNQIELMTEGNR